MGDAKSSKLDEILGRAARDKDFRQKVLDNPKEALKDEGISEEELAAVVGGMKKVMSSSDKICYEHG
jgi:hypothetical protein